MKGIPTLVSAVCADKNENGKHCGIYIRNARAQRHKRIHIGHALDKSHKPLSEEFIIYNDYRRCEHKLIEREPLRVGVRV